MSTKDCAARQPGLLALAAAAAALAALAAGAARAEAPQVDLRPFRPSSGGDGLLGVEGARPLMAGEERVQLKLVLDGAVRPLVFAPDSGGSVSLIKSRFGGALGANAHVWSWLSVAAQLPVTLSQVGDLSALPPSARGPSALPVGLGDLRLTPRAALVRQGSDFPLDLAVQGSLDLPTARAGSMLGSGSVAGELLVAAARRLPLPSSELELIGNVFDRLQPARDFLDVQTGNALGVRAGAALWVERVQPFVPRRVFVELEGQTYLRDGLHAGSTPVEWRIGATFCAVRGLSIEAGGGSAIGSGIGAPAAHFLMALSWAPSQCGQGPAASVARAPAAAQPADAASESKPVAVEDAPPAPRQAEPAAPAPHSLATELPPLPALPLPDVPATAAHPAPAASAPLARVEPPRREPADSLVRLDEQGGAIEILEQVRFREGKAALDPRSFALLRAVARTLLAHPGIALVEVQGHTDNRGSPLTNKRLSQARAETVARFLKGQGVAAQRLRAKGYGSERPLVPNLTKRNRDKNRRVEFKVIERAKAGPERAG